MRRSPWSIAAACALGLYAGGCDGDASPRPRDAAVESPKADAAHTARDAAVPQRDSGTIELPPGEPCTNASCTKANGDSAAICRKDQDRCVPLLTPACPQIDSRLPEGEVVIVPVLDQNTTWEVASFAAREINQLGPGLPSVSGEPRRPLVLLRCPSNVTDDATQQAILDHLIDDLGVPGLLPPSGSDLVIEASKRTVPAGVYMLADKSAAPAITHLDDDGLVWRVTSSPVLAMPALALTVADAEAALRGQGVTGTLRLTLVTPDFLYAVQLQDALVPHLRFNGHAALDPSNADSFEIIRAKYPPTLTTADYARIAASIVSAAPHIVVVLGNGEAPGFALALEQMWTETAHRPQYVFSGGNQDVFWLPLIAPELATRIRGSYIPTEGPGFAALKLRYEQNAGPIPYGAPLSYDALYTYAFAYAAADAATSGAVTGRALADAMTKLVGPGPRIEIGPGEQSSNIQRALSLLADGEAIDLQGISGNLDFDLETGEPAPDATLVETWCIGMHDGALQYSAAGQRYDPATDSLVGTFSCPTDAEDDADADAGSML